MDIKIYLSIEHKLKTIPYTGAEHKDSVNYGFKVLKNNPLECSKIAEVQDNEDLKRAIVEINSENTPFFTVGCEKTFVYDEQHKGYKSGGYIEFAFNYVDLVQDAMNYFELFFDFNTYIRDNKFDVVADYHWELTGARFLKNDCTGFTAGVWVSSGYYKTNEQNIRQWGSAIDILSNFLMQWQNQRLSGEALY